MDPTFDHLRHRGWRNQPSQYATQSPFQPSYQNFISPPPVPPAGHFQMAYNTLNGSYYCTLPPPNDSRLRQYRRHEQYNLWDDVSGHGYYVPMDTHYGYWDTQLPNEPTQNGYRLQEDSARASFSLGEQPDTRIPSLRVFSRNDAFETNPSYSWQVPSSHNEDRNDQEGLPVNRYPERPRGRKQHQRSHITQASIRDRTDREAQQRFEPSTPKRSSSRAASPRRDSRPPVEGFLQSAKRMSIDLLTSPFKSERDDRGKVDTNRRNDQDRMTSSTGWKTYEHRRVSRPATSSARVLRRASGSVKHTAKPTRPSRRPSRATSPSTPRHNHQPLPRDYSTIQASPVPARAENLSIGASPHSKSDPLYLGRDVEITELGGWLDVRDSTGNPDWERETFALCDLERCYNCGDYYVPMKTHRHMCRT